MIICAVCEEPIIDDSYGAEGEIGDGGWSEEDNKFLLICPECYEEDSPKRDLVLRKIYQNPLMAANGPRNEAEFENHLLSKEN